MNQEIFFIAEQLKDAYQGDPWYGRPLKALLAEVPEDQAFQKPAGQHSLLELLWHTITWQEFTLHSLQPVEGRSLAYFEAMDWRPLDHADTSLWAAGLARLDETQNELIALLQRQEDSLLHQQVPERSYHFRKLLHGLVQHDIYHAGQIAYVRKLLTAE